MVATLPSVTLSLRIGGYTQPADAKFIFPIVYHRSMKNILLIQSRMRPESAELERQSYANAFRGRADLEVGSTLDIAWAWDKPSELLKGYDGVILGGSSDLDFHGGRPEDDEVRKLSRDILARLGDFIRFIIEHDIPTLGICYGHQIIAEMLGGKVSYDESQKKAGTHDVVLTDAGREDALFKNLPARFAAQYGHKDSVTGMPEKATLLGTGSTCRFSVLRYGTSVYTVQFHPELTAQEAVERLSKAAEYLPAGIAASSLVHESPEASTIIPLWLDHVVA